MEKKRFCEIVNQLHEATEIQKKVHDIFVNSSDNIRNDFMNSASLQINHESLVVELLEEIMHDKYGYIQCFLYDFDYGKKWTRESITEVDGTSIDISTPEKLYDFLVEQSK